MRGDVREECRRVRATRLSKPHSRIVPRVFWRDGRRRHRATSEDTRETAPMNEDLRRSQTSTGAGSTVAWSSRWAESGDDLATLTRSRRRIWQPLRQRRARHRASHLPTSVEATTGCDQVRRAVSRSESTRRSATKLLEAPIEMAAWCAPNGRCRAWCWRRPPEAAGTAGGRHRRARRRGAISPTSSRPRLIAACRAPIAEKSFDLAATRKADSTSSSAASTAARPQRRRSSRTTT